MFKYFKIKKQLLEDQAYLLHKIREYIDRFPDIVALLDKIKDVDGNEMQRIIAKELVEYSMNKKNVGE